MKVLVNAGNGGHPMGNETCQLIKSWGFDGVRISIPLYAPEENLAAMIEELAANQMMGMLIVGGWQLWIDGQEVESREAHAHEDVAAQAGVIAGLMTEHGLDGWIECGNEPDITKHMKPQRFVDQCKAALSAVWAVTDIPFITGGVSNLSKRGGLKYLMKCVDKGLPRGQTDIAIGIHPYRTGLKPWDKYEGRYINELYQELNDLGGISVTELGWHTAPQKRRTGPLCSKRFQFDDVQVAEFAEWELPTAFMNAIDVYVWYQLNDGPNENYDMHRYGIRRFDTFDDVKPVVKSFIDWGVA